MNRFLRPIIELLAYYALCSHFCVRDLYLTDVYNLERCCWSGSWSGPKLPLQNFWPPLQNCWFRPHHLRVNCSWSLPSKMLPDFNEVIFCPISVSSQSQALSHVHCHTLLVQNLHLGSAAARTVNVTTIKSQLSRICIWKALQLEMWPPKAWHQHVGAFKV